MSPPPPVLASRLADVVVVFHAAYVTFVLGGEVAILLGAWRGWRWVHGFWFRAVHLAAIGLVVVESLLGIVCPLTALEAWLRGPAAARESFIGRLVHRLIFYQAPEWVFIVVYVLFAVLVAATWYWVPVRPKTTQQPRNLL